MADELSKDPTEPVPGNSLSPWLIILFTAPIPLLILAFFFYRWYSEQTDFTQVTRKFVQRQNQVMAYDALTVAREVTQLLVDAASDVQTADLLAPNETKLHSFLAGRTGPVTRITPGGMQQTLTPLYNRLYLLRPDGSESLRLEGGQKQTALRSLKDCTGLCDGEARSRILKEPVGTVRFGRLMRWYRPRGGETRSAEEGLTVLFRGKVRVVELTLDYRHLTSILLSPTFPYEPKRDLLKSYEKGNYIYLVDNRNDILIHPKTWHVAGVDAETNEWVAPVRTDDDVGSGRLNIAEYQGQKLREYFRRLISKSFVQRGVDIFRAPNLGGTNRVLSVAPVALNLGQYQGTFGHLIVGCNVDYFEEPQDQVVPYY